MIPAGVPLPQMGDVGISSYCLNENVLNSALMPPAFDLIIERDGGFITEPIEAADPEQAWRLGRLRHPKRLHAVVRRDAPAATEAGSS